MLLSISFFCYRFLVDIQACVGLKLVPTVGWRWMDIESVLHHVFRYLRLYDRGFSSHLRTHIKEVCSLGAPVSSHSERWQGVLG